MARKKTTTNKKSSSRTQSKTSSNKRGRSTTRGGTRSRTTGSRRGATTKPKARSSKRTNAKQLALDHHVRRQQKVLASGIIIAFVSFVLVLSLIWPNQGQLTTAISNLSRGAFGWGSLFTPFILLAVGIYLISWGMDKPIQLPTLRLIGSGSLFLVFGAFASLLAVALDNGQMDVWQVAEAQGGGGYIGSLLADILIQAVGKLGAVFSLMILGLICGVIASGVTRAELVQYGQSLAARRANDPILTNSSGSTIRFNPTRQSRSVVAPATSTQLIPETETAESPPPPPINETNPPPEKPKRKRGTRRQSEPQTAPPSQSVPTPIFLGNNSRPGQQQWQLPTVAELLESGTDQSLNNSAIREQVEVIEHTLESFGAPATVVEINQGPTIVQFGVEPNFIEQRSGKRTKVKVGKIAGLADDLALALAARSIRIQAPVPGKGYVGIEVPTPAKALVSLRDVMESAEYEKIKSPLRIGLGQNVSGQPIAANLAAMPHLLIAGTTGSGKSVCVNGIIASLLLQNTPDTLKLVMVDPKRVELTGYNGIPHLAAPVVVEMDRVIGTLQWALREMDTRYKSFAEVGARNIIDYNKRVKRLKDVDALPYIVIIIDELADLMMLAPEDTERSITRLAQMARATGIHMVIATQRPSVDVVTGLIKANFPARIAFAVASSTDSRVVLDSTGAERLLGQGDMLFQSPDAAAPLRLQGCYVSDGELNKIIEYWKTARRFNMITAANAVAKPETPTQPNTAVSTPPSVKPKKSAHPAATNGDSPSSATVKQSKEKGDNNGRSTSKPATPTTPKKPKVMAQPPLWEALEEIDSNQPKYDDELMPEAIALVRKLDKASTSLLQRRFRIGYTRAARLIDTMEEQGIIGPPTGTSKARDVLPWTDDGDVQEVGESSDDSAGEEETAVASS